MTVDWVMFVVALVAGAALLLRNAQLAALLREADERYREHPWVQVFEPANGPLATERGRFVAFRAYYAVCGGGFLVIATGLLARVL